MEVGVVPSILGASPSSKYKVSGGAGGKFAAKSFGRNNFSSSSGTADPTKMSKKAFKEMKKERRAKKPNFEAIDAANSLWKISISRLDSDKRIEHVGLVLEVWRLIYDFYSHESSFESLLHGTPHRK